MLEVKDQKSNVFEIPDIRNALIKNVQEASSIPKDIICNGKSILSQAKERSHVAQEKEMCATVHTEANINWALIINRVTISNMIKCVLTIQGAREGARIGAKLFAGLGNAISGPEGAVTGYGVGRLFGFGAGAVVLHQFGEFVANKLEDQDQKNIVEKGITNLNIDSIMKSNA